MRIVPNRRFGSLEQVVDVAKAITGFDNLIWRAISEFVLDGLAGETTMPIDKREK